MRSSPTARRWLALSPPSMQNRHWPQLAAASCCTPMAPTTCRRGGILAVCCHEQATRSIRSHSLALATQSGGAHGNPAVATTMRYTSAGRIGLLSARNRAWLARPLPRRHRGASQGQFGAPCCMVPSALVPLRAQPPVHRAQVEHRVAAIAAAVHVLPDQGRAKRRPRSDAECVAGSDQHVVRRSRPAPFNASTRVFAIK